MLSFRFVETGRSDIDSPSTRTVSSQQVIGIEPSDPEHPVQRKEPFMLKILLSVINSYQVLLPSAILAQAKILEIEYKLCLNNDQFNHQHLSNHLVSRQEKVSFPQRDPLSK